ncbi:hypothetical protein NL521_29530, partial [Klebsiella pneumoniae]|nr:hypothetical protein [Klebsiella pneumoniae]
MNHEQIPRCNMTARYTNDEWAALIRDAERALAPSRAGADEYGYGNGNEDAARRYRLPRLGPELAKCIDHTLLKLDATG